MDAHVRGDRRRVVRALGRRLRARRPARLHPRSVPAVAVRDQLRRHVATFGMLCFYVARDVRARLSLWGVIASGLVLSGLVGLAYLTFLHTGYTRPFASRQLSMTDILWGLVGVHLLSAVAFFLLYAAVWKKRYSPSYFAAIQYQGADRRRGHRDRWPRRAYARADRAKRRSLRRENDGETHVALSRGDARRAASPAAVPEAALLRALAAPALRTRAHALPESRAHAQLGVQPAPSGDPHGPAAVLRRLLQPRGHVESDRLRALLRTAREPERGEKSHDRT